MASVREVSGRIDVLLHAAGWVPSFVVMAGIAMLAAVLSGLLLHRAELTKISRQIQDPGLTIVPLSLYFLNGRVKVEIGVARGNREYDKRHKLREQQDNREAQRAMRMRNRRAGVA